MLGENNESFRLLAELHKFLYSICYDISFIFTGFRLLAELHKFLF